MNDTHAPLLAEHAPLTDDQHMHNHSINVSMPNPSWPLPHTPRTKVLDIHDTISFTFFSTAINL